MAVKRLLPVADFMISRHGIATVTVEPEVVELGIAKKSALKNAPAKNY